MPPQQPHRLLDVFDQGFGFGAHGGLSTMEAGESTTVVSGSTGPLATPYRRSVQGEAGKGRRCEPELTGIRGLRLSFMDVTPNAQISPCDLPAAQFE
jgi:hypothetical protein